MHKLDDGSLAAYSSYATSELELAEVKLFKTLPTYLGKASLLKHKDSIIFLNKFAAIKRGSWEERSKQYARLAKLNKFKLNTRKRKDKGKLIVQDRVDAFSKLSVF